MVIWNWTHHHAAVDPQVIIAALTAAAFLYSRTKVTPVADPKDGNGVPLKASPLPVITVNAAAGSAEIGRQIVAAIKQYEDGRGLNAATAPEKTLTPPAATEPPLSVPELLAPPVVPPAAPE